MQDQLPKLIELPKPLRRVCMTCKSESRTFENTKYTLNSGPEALTGDVLRVKV